jgi:uncharacterized membrane protein YbhN (UPF0104 family)
VALIYSAAGDSFREFFENVGKFFDNLSELQIGPLLIALACQGIWLTLRTRAWYNALRAAYPRERFPWRNIWAAEVAGNGISSIVPAHAGAAVRLYLGKTTVPRSRYATVGSSFLVDAPFDVGMGILILIYGFTQGVFPEIPDLSKLPAFDLAFFAAHPQFAVFAVTLTAIVLLVLFAVLSVRVRDFWANVRQGVAILRSRELYFPGAFAWQALAWPFRLACIWFMLRAFNIDPTLDLALTVLAVQVAASLIPLTPQGAGVQQALLISALGGVIGGALLAAYSVGQQLAISAFNAAFGLLALAVVFRTTDWRALMAEGKAGQAAEKAAENGDEIDSATAEHPTADSATTLEYPAVDEPRDY